MQQIEQTKKSNVNDGEVKKMNDPMDNSKNKLQDDRSATIENQIKYPMLKPVAFSNMLQDDYINGGVWQIKTNY